MIHDFTHSEHIVPAGLQLATANTVMARVRMRIDEFIFLMQTSFRVELFLTLK